MSDSELAAVTALVGAISGLIVAVTGLWRAMRKNTASADATRVELKKNTASTERTEHMVNSKSDTDTTFRELLIKTLKAHGIELPADPGVAAAAERVQKAKKPPR